MSHSHIDTIINNYTSKGFTVLAILNISGKVSVSYFKQTASKVVVNSMIMKYDVESDEYILYHNQNYTHIHNYIDNELNITFKTISKVDNMLLLRDGSFIVKYTNLSIDYTKDNLDIIDNL